MDEETRAHLDAMEGHTAFRGIDATLAAHTELMRSHTELMRNTNTLLDHGKRITDLEKK